jgi:hypothetical protein
VLRKDTNASIRKTWEGVDERTMDDRQLFDYKFKQEFEEKKQNLDSSVEEGGWLIFVSGLMGAAFSGMFESGVCFAISFVLIIGGAALIYDSKQKIREELSKIRAETVTKWQNLIQNKQYKRVNNATYCFHTTYRRQILETKDLDWEKHTSVMGLALSHPVHVLGYQDKDWYLYKDEFWLTNENHTSDDIFYIVEDKKEKKRKRVDKAKKSYRDKPPTKSRANKPVKDKVKKTVFGPDPNLPQVIEEPETQEETGPEPEPMAGDPWSEEEMDVAVGTYSDMLSMEQKELEYDKGPIIKMLREGLGDSPGPLSVRSRQEIKRCMMNISSVLEENFLEHIQGYRPVADMDEHDRGLIEDKLIELGLLEKYTPSPKKSKASKKTNKASKKTNKTSSATKSGEFMRSFLSSEAKTRYTTNPKPKKDHTGKMKERSEIAKLGYNLQISEHSRRIALKRCVTKLGLKKVVDTMVMTLKRFKTRTNADMSGAIAKSEKDLAWLKATYPTLWRGKWRWPNYKEFGNR